MLRNFDRLSVTRENGPDLRVVIQNGEYWMLNKGDLAMLHVTVGRIRERWPHARIGVMTSAPLLLSAFEPEAEPILHPTRGNWPRTQMIGRMAAAAGPRICGPVAAFWLSARHLPQQLERHARRALGPQIRRFAPGLLPPQGTRAADTGTQRDVAIALRDASLLLAMGGGYLTDVDPHQTRRTLDMVEYAVEAGIPTAMVGQGLGPLEHDALVAQAERVLPRVGLISLRERRRGPKLLADLAVPEGKTVVTGDDAIELAAGVRRDELGSGLGICLRIADYSPVAELTRAAVRRAVHRAAHRADAPLVPLIISEFNSEDRRSTMPLVDGFPDVMPPLGRYVEPHEVAARVSHCRVLVTGAYHLAVFALSQGIPVVGLTASRYYDDKLFGLADMFGCGVTVVRLDDASLEAELATAIQAAWTEAEQVREPLRSRADEQIEASRSAFERVFDLVETSEDGRHL